MLYRFVRQGDCLGLQVKRGFFWKWFLFYSGTFEGGSMPMLYAKMTPEKLLAGLKAALEEKVIIYGPPQKYKGSEIF